MIDAAGTVTVSGADNAVNDSVIRAQTDGIGTGGDVTLGASSLALTGGGYRHYHGLRRW